MSSSSSSSRYVSMDVVFTMTLLLLNSIVSLVHGYTVVRTTPPGSPSPFTTTTTAQTRTATVFQRRRIVEQQQQQRSPTTFALASTTTTASLLGSNSSTGIVELPPSLEAASIGNNANEMLPLRRGSTVALVTPFDSVTGQIDVTGLRQLLQYHMEAKTDNLCILGTTAEASVMSMMERELILRIVTNEVKGRIPILVGCGTINPNTVKAMIQQAKDCGADATLLVTPYYVKPPQRSLISHFTTMAYMGLPVVIYNVPSRTGVDMSDESIAIAALHENIVGVKDATGKLSRVANLRHQLSLTNGGSGDKDDTQQQQQKPFYLYSGDDATSMEFVLQGGDGCISVTANVAAASLHQIMMAALQRDVATATAINKPLEALHNDLFCESNPIPVKYVMEKMGLIQSAYCRAPLDYLDPSYESLVDNAIQQAGLWLPPKQQP